jgi:class 3 adenylate cyclase
MSKKGIEPIEIGIGIAKGRALMILAGYKGSGIKDIVWMGDVVNKASKMCSKANKIVSENLVITDSVFIDLNGYGNGKDNYQSFFKKINDFYVSDIIRIDLEDWLNKQIKYFFV